MLAPTPYVGAGTLAYTTLRAMKRSLGVTHYSKMSRKMNPSVKVTHLNKISKAQFFWVTHHVGVRHHVRVRHHRVRGQAPQGAGSRTTGCGVTHPGSGVTHPDSDSIASPAGCVTRFGALVRYYKITDLSLHQ